MASEFMTRGDLVRYTIGRVVIAVGLATSLTPVLIGLKFGADFEKMVSVGSVYQFGLLIAAAVSLFVTSGLSYRSAVLMRDLALAREKLFRLSRTDQLTGLLNRRGFDDLAHRMIAAGEPIGVLMCDVDRFKAINDRHGHNFGDHVLVAIANVFRAFAEDGNAIVAPHGGEEFALLLSGPAALTIKDRAEFLRRRCATTVRDDGKSAPVTVSIGFALATDRADLKHLMRAADRALYTAKRGGRNCVVDANASNSSPMGLILSEAIG